ncbi:hypothetical protein [Rhizobium sp. BK176]|uniref:hypothetical protein n=1 Tax=Rhizobium sp. BK176 TaxID=2587071 RepID=UPI00216897FC|nr:hypothetical protein [Rhizobium sp. BK176]MCS4088744.1 hypothetical protein [Rhizobium sp. BK176]
MTSTQHDRAQTAFAEIERLRMATDEGSLAKRADRMWEIACEMLGRPVVGATPLEIAPEKTPREISVSEVLEAADEWFRERAPAERGDLGMQTAFKDGATWAIGRASENRK